MFRDFTRIQLKLNACISIVTEVKRRLSVVKSWSRWCRPTPIDRETLSSNAPPVLHKSILEKAFTGEL